MHILSASSMLALCSIVLAKNHQFCACQSATDGSINIDATAQVRLKEIIGLPMTRVPDPDLQAHFDKKGSFEEYLEGILAD
ncbi:hypothetical protein CABS01_08982 [Colletotrichum abscissum]|uniref:uncharacterized protein n=1 Tax=Colletotrichum abscissum TaxID=1671311 RepID=UPI0027D62C86|nr:uncharacterized protein CABS01_08982 [Colletotrichum abscissum]KAK1503593.1 hypothetical protein CABS01_08982 [Colletotrichum abscissum]